MSGLTRMGYEAVLYYGTAGSTASTQLTNSQDVNYDVEPQFGDTTIRGDGTLPPIETARPTSRKASLTWKMLNKPADTSLTALRAAAATGAAVALRYKDHSAGSGFDGDCYVTCKMGAPIKGEAAFDFTAQPTADEGRAPNLNA